MKKITEMILGIYRWKLMERVCQDICSTPEGMEYVRKFLANTENKKFSLYEPLSNFFNYKD